MKINTVEALKLAIEGFNKEKAYLTALLGTASGDTPNIKIRLRDIDIEIARYLTPLSDNSKEI